MTVHSRYLCSLRHSTLHPPHRLSDPRLSLFDARQLQSLEPHRPSDPCLSLFDARQDQPLEPHRPSDSRLSLFDARQDQSLEPHRPSDSRLSLFDARQQIEAPHSILTSDPRLGNVYPDTPFIPWTLVQVFTLCAPLCTLIHLFHSSNPTGLNCEDHSTSSSAVYHATMSHDIDDSVMEDDVDDEWDDGDLAAMMTELRFSRRRRKSSFSSHDSSSSPPLALSPSVLEVTDLLRQLLPAGDPLPLTSRFSSLDVTSFSDLLISARKFAPFHPMRRAAEAARTWAVENPSDRVSLTKVAEDTATVQKHGILHLLSP